MKRIGSRAQVYHGNAVQTSGGLKKKNLFKDKHGCIKSKKASKRARKNKNLGGMLKQKGSGCFDYKKTEKMQLGGGKNKKNVELDKNDESLGGEVLKKVIDTKQESFIPPQPEVIEKEIITPEEIQIDPFTEAEVLNASSNIQTNNSPDEKVEEVKETESLIKRFTAPIFGNLNKKNIEITDNIESVKSNLEETNVDNEDGINDELSFSQDISMKSTEKNTNEDELDIPAFLRRQRE